MYMHLYTSMHASCAEGLVLGMEDPRLILVPKAKAKPAATAAAAGPDEQMLVLLWGGGSVALRRWAMWAMGIDVPTLAPVTA